MTFMSNLAANPSGIGMGSGIFGQPPPNDDMESLGIYNRIKDREMKDFTDKANFMSDLSLRQERLRQMYNPDQNQQGPQNTANMNTVLAHDPNALSGYQKGELGIRQQGVNLESQKLAQQGKLGQESLDVRTAQEKLNQQKSDQINAQKQADMQRKIDDSNRKLDLAERALTDKTKNAQEQLQAQKDYRDAVEERHKLQMTQQQTQFDRINSQHEETIKNMQKRLDQSGRTQTTTETNPEGTKRTITTQRGTLNNVPRKNPDGSYHVVSPDGTEGDIPADKLDDWMANHQPGPGGVQNNNNNDDNNNNNNNNDETEGE